MGHSGRLRLSFSEANLTRIFFPSEKRHWESQQLQLYSSLWSTPRSPTNSHKDCPSGAFHFEHISGTTLGFYREPTRPVGPQIEDLPAPRPRGTSLHRGVSGFWDIFSSSLLLSDEGEEFTPSSRRHVIPVPTQIGAQGLLLAGFELDFDRAGDVSEYPGCNTTNL